MPRYTGIHRLRAGECGVAPLTTIAEKPSYVTGLGGMFAALVAPTRAFAQVEDVPRYGWPLLLVLTSVALIGYGTVQTGLVDRTVEVNVQRRIAQVDETQRDVVERSVLREEYEGIRKQAKFESVVMRIRAVAAGPAGLLATILIIAAVLFGAVALTGRKAEWNTLLTIVVYAAAIDVIGMLVRFAFMLRYRSMDVDTSLAMVLEQLKPAAAGAGGRAAFLAGLAQAVDPFRMWFWATVVAGLHATRQLPGWRAWMWCTGGWIVGGLVSAGAHMAEAGAALG